MNVLKKAKRKLKKVVEQAGETRLGKQVKKIPAPIRKGWMAGALVPVPGSAEVGALIGSGVWAKGAVEKAVQKRTGRPYRMFETPARALLEFMGVYDGKDPGKGAVVSTKLDGVYARATREGIFSKSGKPLDLPHVSKRLKRHFRKNPDGELEGEVWRKGMPIEEISGAVKSGGDAAKKLRLHVFPKEGQSRPWPIGAVRRVKGKKAETDADVQKVFQKAVKRGGEGVVVQRPDGTKAKLKPRSDEEFEVVDVPASKRGVVVVKNGDRTFKVQGRPGVVAKAGDRVQVSYSGKTRKGTPKAAVAERVRNDQDFGEKTEDLKTQDTRPDSMKTHDFNYASPARLLLGEDFPDDPHVRNPCARLMELARGESVEEEIARDRAALARIGAGAAVAGGTVATVIHHGRKKAVSPAPAAVVPAATTKKKGKAPAPSFWGKKKRVRPKVRLSVIGDQGGVDLEGGSFGITRAALGLAPREVVEKVVTKKATPKFHIVNRKTGEVVGKASNKDGARRVRDKRDNAYGGYAHTIRELEEKRDGLSQARDVAIIGGTGAVGAGALVTAHQASKLRKKAGDALGYASSSVARAAKQVREDVTPQAVAREGVQMVKRKVKRTAGEYFPTFIKAGKGIKRVLTKSLEARRKTQDFKKEEKSVHWMFETPARRLGIPHILNHPLLQWVGYQVTDFATATVDRSKVKDAQGKWVDHYQVATGMKEGFRTDGSKATVGMADPAVLRSLYRKANTANKWGTRGTGFVKDAADVVRGKPRERDASGRKKKREWEKSWAKDAAKKALLVGGAIGYGIAYKKSPKLRRAQEAVLSKAKQTGDEIKDAISNFETPAQRLGITFFAKREEKDHGAAKVGLAGAAIGAANGAAMGGVSAAYSKEAEDYLAKVEARGKRTQTKGNVLVESSPAPFKAKGKFNRAERLARAEHNGIQQSLGKLKKKTVSRAAKGGLGGAALLGGLGYAAAKVARDEPLERQKTSRRKTQEKRFHTPASELMIELDAVAEDAGWDIRDPRGKSARVFAPGSRKRVRREKRWHEEVENERKLWKAGVAGAGLAAGAAGIAVGRRMPKPKGAGKVAALVKAVRKKS